MLFKNSYRIESARLKGFDYSNPGAYFITIVTKNRNCYFGNIENDKMKLNKIGKIVDDCWNEIPEHFPYVILDEYIVMPNHVHGIVFLKDEIDLNIKNKILETPDVETPNVETPKLGVSTTTTTKRQPIGTIINQFKRACTIEIKKFDIEFGWQSRFHDHIIRNENELNRIKQYIIDNPKNWQSDENYK